MHSHLSQDHLYIALAWWVVLRMAPGWCSCGQGWYRGRGVCTAGTDGVNGTHSGPVRQHRERRRALQHNVEEMEMRVEDTDCEESERPPPSAVELVVAGS